MECVVSKAPGLGDAQKVLQRARSMVAQQLAVEPGVRAFLRRTLAEHATLSTGAGSPPCANSCIVCLLIEVPTAMTSAPSIALHNVVLTDFESHLTNIAPS